MTDSDPGPARAQPVSPLSFGRPSDRDSNVSRGVRATRTGPCHPGLSVLAWPCRDTRPVPVA